MQSGSSLHLKEERHSEVPSSKPNSVDSQVPQTHTDKKLVRVLGLGGVGSVRADRGCQ